jgi:hypothetical protein
MGPLKRQNAADATVENACHGAKPSRTIVIISPKAHDHLEDKADGQLNWAA